MRPYETVEKDNEMEKKKKDYTERHEKSDGLVCSKCATKTPETRTFHFVVTGNACQPYKDYNGDLLST